MAQPRDNPAEILVFGNPAGRKKKKAKSKRRFSAAQLANQRRFAAASRARSGRGKTRRAASVRANPAHAVSSYSYARPAKRRSASRAVFSGKLTDTAINTATRGLLGAGGALTNDIAFGYIVSKLPDSVQTPINAEGGVNYLHTLAKSALAFGIALGANMLSAKAGRFAVPMVDGALAVAFHDAIKAQLVMSGSTLPLGRLNPAQIASGPPVPASQRLAMYTGAGGGNGPSSLRRSGTGNLRMYTGGAMNSGAREMQSMR